MQPSSAAAATTPAWLLIALATLAALAHYFAFPPYSLWPLTLLTVPTLTLLALLAPRARVAALFTYIAFILALGAHHFWIWSNSVSRGGYPIIPLYLALYPALFVGGLVLIRKRVGSLAALAFAPAWWIALEALRGEIIFTGYPWYLVGVPLIDAPIIFRGGPYDTALIAIALTLPALLLIPRVRRQFTADLDRPRAWLAAIPTLIALPIALATLIAGWLPERIDTQSTPPRTVAVGVIQTNVPQDNRRDWTLDQRIQDFNRFAALTLAAFDTPIPGSQPDNPRYIDFIVWPETMYPGFFGLTPEAIRLQNEADLPVAQFPNEMLRLSDIVDIPLVIGAVVYENFQPIEIPGEGDNADESYPWFDTTRRFNSVFVLRDGTVDDQRYDKIDLTPFGEAIPHLNNIPWLKEPIKKLGAATMPFDLESATEPRRLAVPTPSAGPVVLGTPICFEASLARATRRLALDDDNRLAIDLLINMTNDGWFGTFPGGQAKHLLHARWRAAELRTPMLRAANTGISSWINADGTVMQRGPTHTVDPGTGRVIPLEPGSSVVNVDGFLVVEVPIRSTPRGVIDRPKPGPLAFARRGNLPAALCLFLAGAIFLRFMLLPPTSRNQ